MFDIDLTQFAFATTIIIGLINGVTFAIDRKWKPFVYWCLAVTAGSIFGFLQWYGIPSIEIGFALGVSSSGIYKLAQKI